VPGSIFDCREGLDIAAASVREWKTQNRQLSALQETLASRPTFDPINKLVDFGTAGALVAYPTATLRSIWRMPDSTISPFNYPPGGAMWCGMALRDDRMLVVTNDGRKSPTQVNWTSPVVTYPTLALINEGTLLIRPGFEVNLRTVTSVAGGFFGSAQGVDWYVSGGKFRYMVADHAAGIARCIEDSGDNNGASFAHISAADITPDHGSGSGNANGIYIDRAANEIFIGQAGDGTSYPTVSVHSIAAGDYGTFKRSFIFPHKDLDMFTSFRGLLVGLCGANAEYCDFVFMDKQGRFQTSIRDVPGGQAIEGGYGDDQAGTICSVHDGNYHQQGNIDASILCKYDVAGIASGVIYTPTRVLIGFIGRLTTTTSTPLFALGRTTIASNGDVGWGIYYNGASTMKLAAVQRGVAYGPSWNCTNTSEHLVTVDVSTDTGVINSARVNGVAQTITGDLAGYTYGLSSLGCVLGGERNAAGTVLNPGFVQLATKGTWSLDDIASDGAAIAARITAVEAALNSNLERSLL
jgi:hypothetical protein